MSSMNRTAIIYQPDPDKEEFVLALIYADRAPVRRLYDNITDMRTDVLEHLALDVPCVSYGREYNGELTNLLVGIISEYGKLSIRYNPIAEAGETVKYIFGDITVREILCTKKAAAG